MKPRKVEFPQDFSGPIILPQHAEQAYRWRDKNRSWWERNPLRYDRKQKIGYKEFTKEFYSEIDRRFFLDVKTYMPWKKIPFDVLVDFDSLKDWDVLEIGVGSGSTASLFARYARSFTGIDITDYAVKLTQERMRLFGLKAEIRRIDAECMEFGDNTFDFIWAWGVVHHTSNPLRLLQEMQRVLRPAGIAITMVYHRGFWNYYVIGGFFLGVLQAGLLRTGWSLHKTMQHYTDGAIARFYSLSEWKALVSERFYLESIRVLGSKSDIVLLPAGKVKDFLSKLIPNSLVRIFTNRCKMGSLLVSILRKNRA